MCWSSATLLAFSALFTVTLSTNVTVVTKKGPVVGLRWDPNPATKASYDAFVGIPYGKPSARFQLAVPPPSWTAPLTTWTDGPACPQPGGMAYSEDCLYLNVFTPVNASMQGAKYPVIAYIHGSAFTISSSNSKVFGPDFLVPEDVILVTFNYRLGAAGFLTLGSKVAPGNLGLQDSTLALKWVQQEISAFGGDPAQVTLMGQSAGSVMTQFHYLSSFSTDLFLRAISHSGSAHAGWGLVTPNEGARRAKMLAKAVGCDTTQNDTVVLACLQAVDIHYIVGNQSIPMPLNNQISGNDLPFVPVMDSYLTADQPFFNDTLANLMQQALTRNKPLLTGFNTDDGIIKFMYNNWNQTEANLAAFIPQPIVSAISSPRAVSVSDIHSRYFPDTPDEDKVEDTVRLFTDYMFGCPSVQTTKYFANMTYGYLFAYDGSWVKVPPYFSKFKLTGVNHGDELYYLFYGTIVAQSLDNCTLNMPNLKMKQQMVTWWTNFAKTGKPDDSWQTVSSDGYMVIDSTPSKMNSSMFESQYYSFWAAVQQGNSSPSCASLSLTLVLWGLLSVFLRRLSM